VCGPSYHIRYTVIVNVSNGHRANAVLEQIAPQLKAGRTVDSVYAGRIAVVAVGILTSNYIRNEITIEISCLNVSNIPI